jgi:hypothetical protein
MEIRSGPPRGKAALAWLVPWVGIAVMWAVSSALEDGIGFARSSAIALLVGVLLGVWWYLLYPRALARRLVWPLALIGLWVLIIGLFDQLDAELFGSVVFTPLGIVIGLAFAELRASGRRSSFAAEPKARATQPQ